MLSQYFLLFGYNGCFSGVPVLSTEHSEQKKKKNMPMGWRDGLVVEKYLLLF